MNTWISSNRYLTTAEMQNNAQIVYDRLKYGWTKNAICAALANMQCESNINPGIWQGLKAGRLDLGFGLSQWTPATKYRNWHDAYFGDGDYTNGDKQLSRIIYEVNNGMQWASVYSEQGLTFKAFTQSTLDPYILAIEYLICYERPETQSSSVRALRGSIAQTWWNYFGGESGGDSGEGGVITPPETPITPPVITTYNVTTSSSEGGACLTDITTTYSGETVHIIPGAKAGYKLSSITITGSDGKTYYAEYLTNEGIYRFVMPECNVHVHAVFERDPAQFPIWLLFKLGERRL